MPGNSFRTKWYRVLNENKTFPFLKSKNNVNVYIVLLIQFKIDLFKLSVNYNLIKN